MSCSDRFNMWTDAAKKGGLFGCVQGMHVNCRGLASGLHKKCLRMQLQMDAFCGSVVWCGREVKA